MTTKISAIKIPREIPENLVVIKPAYNLPSLPKSLERYSTALAASFIPRVTGLFENLTILKPPVYKPKKGAIMNKTPSTNVKTSPIIIP